MISVLAYGDAGRAIPDPCNRGYAEKLAELVMHMGWPAAVCFIVLGLITATLIWMIFGMIFG